MAYITREKISTNLTETYDDFCQLLLDCGYEEVDTISITNRIFKSTGETGQEFPLYFQIEIAGYYLKVTTYLYWNTISHMGVCPLYNYINLSISNPTSYRFYCSKDILYSGETINNGLIRLTPNDRIKVLTTTQTIGGSSVTIQLDSLPVEIQIGFYYNILGIEGEGQQQILVTNKDEVNNTITVTGCTNTYAAGAWVGRSLSPCWYFSAGLKFNPLNFNRNGQTAVTSPAVALKGEYGEMGEVYSFDNRIVLEPFIVTDTYRCIGSTPSQIMYGKLPVSAYNNVALLSNIPENLIISSPTSFTDYTLTDETKNWDIDSLIGKNIYFTNGTGENYSRYIIGNTANTLQFRTILPTITTSTGYIIVDEVYRNCNNVFSRYNGFIREEF